MQKPERGITGVYKITSPSGKVYIGQSMDIERRRRNYKTLPKKTDQPKIHNSLRKHGWDKHIFEVIEECSIEQLDERETFWKIHYLKQVNNDWQQVLFCGLYDSGGGPKSEEHKRKIGEGNKGKLLSDEAKSKIGDIHRGLKYSQESKDKISQAKLGHKYSAESSLKKSISLTGKPKSEEHKNNLSKALGKSIIQYSLDGIFIQEWPSMSKASKSLKIHQPLIGKCCNGLIDSYNNYKWKFK